MVDKGTLYIDLPLGESVDIDNGRVVMTLESKSGQQARLRFDAERSVKIYRTDEVQSAPRPTVNNGVAMMAANGIHPAS